VRLWTLHPRHLDPAGLVAAWREALLAQAVLAGRTRGYRHHPQLDRFRDLSDPAAAIARYLDEIRAEGARRGYAFDAGRIDPGPRRRIRIPATRGQLEHEWRLLGRKLRRRNRAWYAASHRGVSPAPHPLFRLVPGGVSPWERM
jgi:hypothetical protein